MKPELYLALYHTHLYIIGYVKLMCCFLFPVFSMTFDKYFTFVDCIYFTSFWLLTVRLLSQTALIDSGDCNLSNCFLPKHLTHLLGLLTLGEQQGLKQATTDLLV